MSAVLVGLGMMRVALVVEGLAATVFDTFEVAIYHSVVNYTTLG